MEDDSGKRKAEIPTDEEPPDKKPRTNDSVQTIYSQSKNILDNWGSEESHCNNIDKDDEDPTGNGEITSPSTEDASANEKCALGETESVDTTKNNRSPSEVCDPSNSPKVADENRDDAGKKIKWDCARHFSDQNDRSRASEGDNSNVGDESNATAAATVSSNEPPRNKCAYGARCYRRNSEHRRRFSHPGDQDYDVPDARPECPYGVKCYRKNPQHKRDFRHTNLRPSRAQTPIRGGRRRGSDAASCTDQSSAEESVDESDYEPSCYAGTSDEYRSDLDAFSDFEGISDCDDDK